MAMRERVHASGVVLALFSGTLMAQQSAEHPEVIVVTASRTEESAASAAAAVSVITAADIARSPADDFGDLLRNVPGINVAQTNARDINVTARGATKILSNSQITLLDGRSTYLDFFGINMWDLLPLQPDEIEQIEVVRGPGGALYGANAMSGVVNIISKRPRDMIGTTLVVGTPYVKIVHADGDDDFAYKISAGLFEQSAYARPRGEVPGSKPPQVYPEFDNEGTTQARVNTRFDWGLGGSNYLSIGAGIASTDGIIHTGIGPFDIDHGTGLSYLQADWHCNELHIGASVRMLDGDATNLLTLAADGNALGFEFVDDTRDLDISNTSDIGDRHTLTYGGSLRMHGFDLAIAPLAGSKNERGVFVQDDIRLSDDLRWVVGIRYDDIDPLHDTVLTPRTSLVYAVSPRHSIRISYNEAFRTPSAINAYLDVGISQAIAPGVWVPAAAVGDAALTQESLEAYEIGYAGRLDSGTELSLSIYRNETADSIDFYVSDYYGPTQLPLPGATLPAALIPCFGAPPGTVGACPQGGLAGIVPATYSYRNIGRTVDRGLELSIERELDAWYVWANASWQDEPRIEGADPIDVNRAPAWRFNLGAGRDAGAVFWNATVNYQGTAYWADVLFASASTDAFTQVNASVGWRFREEKLAFKLIGQNLFDASVQQHIFGDIIGRKVAAQIRVTF